MISVFLVDLLDNIFSYLCVPQLSPLLGNQPTHHLFHTFPAILSKDDSILAFRGCSISKFYFPQRFAFESDIA